MAANVWTKKLPTEPGFYWRRTREEVVHSRAMFGQGEDLTTVSEDLGIVEVELFAGEFVVVEDVWAGMGMAENVHVRTEEMGAEWCGPLQQPEEPECK